MRGRACALQLHKATRHYLDLPVLQSATTTSSRSSDGWREVPDSLPVDWMRYESHQPPLYYALAAPVYILAQANRRAAGGGSRMLSTAIVRSARRSYLLAASLPKDEVVPLAPRRDGVCADAVAILRAVENDRWRSLP